MPLTVPPGAAVSYRLIEVDRLGATQFVGETAVGRPLLAGIELNGALVTINLRGEPYGRAVVEMTAEVARGPWREVATATLDAQGRAEIVIGRDAVGAAAFYRIRD